MEASKRKADRIAIAPAERLQGGLLVREETTAGDYLWTVRYNGGWFSNRQEKCRLKELELPNEAKLSL
jgi:hypothetical protein